MRGVRDGGDALDLEGQRALASVLAGIGKRPVAKLRVGRYELGESLGRGGCGQVFAARDPDLDREVAIKVVAAVRERAGNPDRAAEARLLREGQALARLQHPNAVTVYDVGIDEMGAGLGAGSQRGVFIVMERIHGRTLSQWLRESSPSPAEIVRAYLDAARGLAAAHAVGVVHRDFKPSNAMVTGEGTVVVLDFGLATALDERASQDTDTDLGAGSSSTSSSGAAFTSGSRSAEVSLTATGVVMGTPRYMAPEQHAARPATAATDQYAWCVALWEALTGAPPFAASSIEALAQAKREGKLPPAPTVPANLRAALARGLSADPAQRFESMRALVDAIERGPARRRRRWLVLGGVIAVAMGAVSIARPTSEPPLCERAPQASERPWNLPAMAELVDEVAARPGGTHPLMRDRVESRLDRFARGWDEMHAEVCGPASEAIDAETRHVQAECLERAEARWFEMLDVLENGSLTELPWLSPLWALPSPRRCATEPSAAFALVEADELTEARRAIEEVSLAVGPPPPLADTELDHALEIADRYGDHALGANALMIRARSLTRTQNYGEATRAASLAAWRAQGADDALLAAEILPESLFIAVIRGAPPHEIDAMLTSARELERTAGSPRDLRLRLDQSEAFALEYRGDVEGALAKYSALAEELTTDPMPHAPFLLTQALEGTADIYMRRGEHWAALNAFERVIEHVSAHDRDDDKAMFVGNALSRQADAALYAGRLDLAITSSARAVQLLSESDAEPDHLAMELAQYGYVLGVRGGFEEGRAIIEDALARLTAPGDTQLKPTLLHQLAHLHEIAGEPARAAVLVQQLRGILVDMGESHPDYEASLWAWLACMHARAGATKEADDALAQADKAIAAVVADPSLDLPALELEGSRSSVTRARAEVAAARGDWPLAREATLSALAHPSLYSGTPLSRGDLGELYWLLARALHHTGNPEAAQSMATLANETLTGADPLRKKHRPNLATWQSNPT
jgi:serine/threonine protein kinase